MVHPIMGTGLWEFSLTVRARMARLGDTTCRTSGYYERSLLFDKSGVSCLSIQAIPHMLTRTVACMIVRMACDVEGLMPIDLDGE